MADPSTYVCVPQFPPLCNSNLVPRTVHLLYIVHTSHHLCCLLLSLLSSPHQMTFTIDHISICVHHSMQSLLSPSQSIDYILFTDLPFPVFWITSLSSPSCNFRRCLDASSPVSSLFFPTRVAVHLLYSKRPISVPLPYFNHTSNRLPQNYNPLTWWVFSWKILGDFTCVSVKGTQYVIKWSALESATNH